MWNFSFVIPSIMILLILLGYYFNRPKLPTRINETFIALLGVDCLVIFSDVLSSAADNHFSYWSEPLLYIINLLYFVLFLARIFCFFYFTTDMLKMKLSHSPKQFLAYSAVFLGAEAITLLSPFLHTVFFIGENGYQNGPFYNIIYVVFVFYILLSLVLIARHGGHLKKEERFVAVLFNIVLLAGNLFRFLFPTYLIMHTFCLMAIVMIYLTFVNPDLYRSNRGPVFNDLGFYTVLDEIHDTKQFRILCAALRNYSYEREIYSGRQMDEGIALIADYLNRKYPDRIVFYLRNGRFGIIGDSAMDWDSMQKEIYDRFQKPWNAEEADLFLNVSFVRVSSISGQDSADVIISRLLAAFNDFEKSASEAGSLTDLDQVRNIDRQVDVKRALERAIEENRVELFLQPIIESKTDRMCGAEVLARIRRENGELISPGLFIPIAEQNGQINRLGKQMFEKTCAFIRDGNLERTGMEWLNINLSPIQCMKKDLAGEFCAIIDQYDVSADLIHLEVTEGSVIDLKTLDRQLSELRDKGFTLVLDDYGTGYSNLTHVKHYPFSVIKFDMEVVWDYIRDRDAVLPSIVRAFKGLNLALTAEGVETAEMADEMKKIGCDYLQGFYYSMPLPAEEFVRRYAK